MQMLEDMGEDATEIRVIHPSIQVQNAWGRSFHAQVHMICVPHAKMSPGEVQPPVLVRSMVNRVTGEDMLQDVFQRLQPDNTAQDTIIPVEFLLTQTQDREGGASIIPPCAPITVPPPPVIIMPVDAPPAVPSLDTEVNKVSSVTTLY